MFLPCLPLSCGGAFLPVTLLTTSWALAHDVISPISSLFIRVRDNIRGPLRGRPCQGPCSHHRVPLAWHHSRGHSSFTRRRRPCDGVSCSCDLLVRMDHDGRTRGIGGWPCRCVHSQRLDTIQLGRDGVDSSCPLDDSLRLPHSALVSALAAQCPSFTCGSHPALPPSLSRIASQT